MKKIIVIILLLNALMVKAQDELNIVPRPVEVKMKNEKTIFVLSSQTKIYLGHNAVSGEYYSDYLNEFIIKTYGYRLKTTSNFKNVNAGNYIEISFTPVAAKPENLYNIEVGKKNISVVSHTGEGLFNGIQTLIQLLPPPKLKQKNYQLSIPQLTITDYPRFAYRGMHLDVGRHFFPVSFIKKYIDYLAEYKFNTFHWHLTEDQGWRIEIKKYPNLTKVGAFREGTIIGPYPGTGNDGMPYGGYYTQKEIKEVVKYAADRYITVIPEIEMPGHSLAALASYPYLGCTKGPYKVAQTWGVFDDVYCVGSDSTFTFLQNVLDEVIQLFPSKYIHIGGDECPKERWKTCNKCQQRIKDNNLKDEHGLQSYFINRIEKYINSKGRSIIGWDEILEGGLAPNATVMSWRGEEGGIEAAKQNHDVIMTPGKPVYFDHSQSKNEDSITIGGYNNLEAVYKYEPVPAVLNAEQAKHVLGAQANVWTEYMKNTRKIEYMVFPRIMALSEVLWSPKEKRDWKDFERRLPVLFDRLDKDKTNYSKAYYDLQVTMMPSEKNEGVILFFDELKNQNSLQKIFVQKKTKLTAPATANVYNEYGVLKGQKTIDSSNSYFIPLSINRKVNIETSSTVTAKLLKGDNSFGFEVNYDDKHPLSIFTQKFSFNKATGKKITIANPPSNKYPGDGAFTLVNGVQNEKGMGRGSEFLGFSGTDLDVIIDLGDITEVKKITLHALGQSSSWIHLPASVEVQYIVAMDDGSNSRMPPIRFQTKNVTPQNGNAKLELTGKYECRYIRVIAKNIGTIPTGNPGAGEKAWLFADEIEVE